jgi:uncharacterized membrane protein
MENEKEYIKEEIRKEFQLERMILFSDAVFAIVITLMAIEIRVPEFEHGANYSFVSHELVKIIPNLIAYAVSFFFIGSIWYQHLQLFSLLKDFDKGVVVRNLIMLFFIGLFPFSAALMVRLGNGFTASWVIYFLVIVISKGAQLVLQHYILFKRPELRIKTSVHEEIVKFRRSRISVSLLTVVFILTMITHELIGSSENKDLAWLWVVPLPIVLRIVRRRIK